MSALVHNKIFLFCVAVLRNVLRPERGDAQTGNFDRLYLCSLALKAG